MTWSFSESFYFHASLRKGLAAANRKRYLKAMEMAFGWNTFVLVGNIAIIATLLMLRNAVHDVITGADFDDCSYMYYHS